MKALITHFSLQIRFAQLPITRSGKATGFSGALVDIYKHLRRAEQGADFSPAELLLLRELSYRLDDKGQVKWTRAKTPTASNLQFAFRMYAKASQIDYTVPRGDSGWQDFKRAIKVRDRLTHPKRPQDLDVSEDETQTVLRAYKWLFECQIVFGERLREKIESEKKGGQPDNLPPNSGT